MLRELHISNLAVITDARIELTAGLNCFTGATGAGKSLVIGAIELLLGLRSPTEMLRTGADEGRVSGLFEVRDPDLLKQLQRDSDTPLDTDELLLTRRIYSSGRSSISLNGHPITLPMLKAIAEHLVDVHGQHDHQFLLKPSNQLDVLDHFGAHWSLRQKYHDVYSRLSQAKARLAELTAGRTLRRQQLELYRFQADEIDTAELDPGEYQELESRASVLKNLEKLKKDAGAAYGALYETDGSVLERLKMISAVLSELSGVDINLKDIAQNTRDATLQLEEVAFDLSRYLDKLDLDPSELAEINERLNVLNRILNKYGQTIEATLDYRKDIGRQIEELEKATDDLSSLESQLDPLNKDLRKLGDELTAKRLAAARRLTPLMQKQLAELGMDKAKFTVGLEPAAEPQPAGLDQIEFIAQTNPGQSPQPLRKIASGGELSRIMLALKGILAQSDRTSVLVFDEIDANVGGRLGSIIGDKLRSLAAHHQVLCITHLPQIAAYADRHLTVRKTVEKNLTQTTVRTMQGPERLEELAEMIGGHHVTDTTRAQARELLDAAVATPAKPSAKVAKPSSKR